MGVGVVVQDEAGDVPGGPNLLPRELVQVGEDTDPEGAPRLGHEAVGRAARVVREHPSYTALGGV